jgi:predicted O-methyltransferase YrrM
LQISLGNTNPRNLEIGTLNGYFAILMASFLDDDTEDMVGDVITIEIDKTFAEIAKKI